METPASDPGSDRSPPIPAPLAMYRTAEGMHVSRYSLALESIPADFYADPDGSWSYEALLAAAGFSVEQGVAIGALRAPFNGHPDGSAVVTLNAESRPYVAIIECPVAYQCVEEAERSEVSAA
jgi:hypothetical protein